MSMLQALAMLGSGTEGFVQGRNDAAAQARLQSAEDFAQKNRQFQLSQQQRTLNQQAAVATAGAPAAVSPDTVTNSDGTTGQPMTPDPSGDNIDAGQPGTAPPIAAPTFRVNGQSGMTAAARDTAVAAYNDPQARAMRQAAALGTTDPVAAAQLSESSARQQSVQIDLASKVWNNDVDAAVAKAGTTNSPDALAEFMSKSAGDGMGGAFKVKAVVSPDGKSFGFVKILPDGTTEPTSMPPMPNNKDGYQAVALGLQKIPVQQQVDHMLAQRAQQEKVAHDQAMEKNAAEHNRVLEEGWMGRNQAMQTRADAAASGGGVGRRGDHFTDQQWGAVRKIDPETISFPDPTGGKGAPSPELHNVYQQRLTELRLGGTMDPDEAAADARQKTMQVRDLATARVQQAKKDNSDSTLTEQQAVTAIMREAQARAAAAAAARNRPPVAPPVVAPPVGMQATGAAAAAPPVPGAAPPAAGMQAAQPVLRPTGDQTMNAIEAKNQAAVEPLNDQVRIAMQQLAGAAKSGDARALNLYATNLTKARAARDAAARAAFGNNADKYIAAAP